MEHTNKPYEIPDEKPQMVSEPAVTYGYSANPQHVLYKEVEEESNSEKKTHLRKNLHSTTVNFLESVDWMENKPFPIYSDSNDDSWIDAAEAVGNTDIVDDNVIIKDRLAWHSLR